ncbi:MAG: hypothetical protein H7Y04_15385 [Verrucomicrobia bacterium]|nr:hypothetical protein [Cytophagales bacterium]
MKTLNIIYLTSMVIFGLFSCNKASQQNTDSENKINAVTQKDTTSATTSDGNFCFIKSLNKDTTYISLTIKGNEVAGTMIWNPYEKDGATGTLSGIKNAEGEFDLIYDYVIEGSKQTETKIMKIEKNQLMIKEGELVDPKNDGNLKYKDLSKAKFNEVLDKTACK